VINGRPRTANAAWDDLIFPGYDLYSVPLGASEGVTSPWGLMDVAGATSELTEEVLRFSFEQNFRTRRVDGSARIFSTNGSADTVAYLRGDLPPSFPAFEVGLRVAAIVPAPGLGSLGIALLGCTLVRRRQ
jgi:hypothetical protein